MLIKPALPFIGQILAIFEKIEVFYTKGFCLKIALVILAFFKTVKYNLSCDIWIATRTSAIC